MLKYGLIACFGPVIKINIGEHKFDCTGSAKIGKWKKIGVSGIQKVAKTGNIRKKNSSSRRYRLCKIPQHAEG